MLNRAALLCTLLASATPALFAQKVDVDSDNAFDFSSHRRYQWRDHPLALKDPIMREATVAAEVIRSRVNENLMGRGFQPVDEKPDFYVTFFVTGHVYEELNVLSSVGTTYWYGWGSPVFIDGWAKYRIDRNVDAVLLIDLVNAENNQLTWRAYCRDTVKDWKKRTENIDRAVAKAFKKFPPTK